VALVKGAAAAEALASKHAQMVVDTAALTTSASGRDAVMVRMLSEAISPLREKRSNTVHLQAVVRDQALQSTTNKADHQWECTKISPIF
jgi:hypothetical protein